jgi:DNA polymerase-3 subunit gamma/tau
LDQLHRALDAGSDPRQFARQIVEALRGALLLRMGAALGPEYAGEESVRLTAQAKALTVPELLRNIRLFNEAASEARNAWQPSLPLEMAFVAAIEGPAADALPAATAPAVKSAQPASAGSKPATAAQRSAGNPPAAATPEAKTNTLDQQTWSRVKDQVKTRNPNLLALLNSVKVRELNGSELKLGFASDLLKEKMEKPENIEQLQNILDETLNGSFKVQCFLAGNRAGELPAGLDNSGMVAAAVRLGGEIVDSSDLGNNNE